MSRPPGRNGEKKGETLANTELEIMKNSPAEGSTGERKLLLEQKFKASTLKIHGMSERERRKTAI